MSDEQGLAARLQANLYHRRLRNWEPFDEIKLKVVPRYKTSGLSGDEWRQSACIEFFHKGVMVAEQWYGSMQAAVTFLPSLMYTLCEPIPEAIIPIEDAHCDQPSCRNKAAGRYRMKRLFSRTGELLDASDQPLTFYRKFCKVHARRGDCSREDGDSNYEPLDDLKPDDSENVQESPSGLAVADLTESK